MNSRNMVGIIVPKAKTVQDKGEIRHSKGNQLIKRRSKIRNETSFGISPEVQKYNYP